MYGQRLKEARKARGITLVKAGMELNTTHETISRYENEKREPSIRMLKEMCILYNISADYIIGITNNKNINRSTNNE